MVKLLVFLLVSVLLAYLSRDSLRAPRSHGFYRFFAAEAVLMLILLNAARWFEDPLCPRQIVSWGLLAGSTVLVIHGFYLLHAVGRPDHSRVDEIPLAGIEKTTSLVTAGAYRYIRHPIYASVFYGIWGIFLKDPSWLGAVFALSAIAFIAITAKMEEAECIRYFGVAYHSYMKRTKMFVPFLF